MNAAVVKATRRALRRAVGVSVVQDVQQLEEAIRTLGGAVNEQRQGIAQIANHQVALAADIARLRADIAQLRAPVSWPARLRQCVTGR